MRFTAHNRPRITSKQIPRRPRNSAAAWAWEASIMAIAAVGAVAFLVVGLQRYERGADLGTPSATAEIVPAIHTPPPPADQYDGLPSPLDYDAIAKADAEATRNFLEDWAPKTTPRTGSTRALYADNYPDAGRYKRHRDHMRQERPRDGQHGRGFDHQEVSVQ